MLTAGRLFSIVLLLAMLSATAIAASDQMIRPGTPEGTQALARLRQAEVADRMNYQAYLGSRENTAAMYYLAKHRHIVADIAQLQSGEPISKEDLETHLDTSGAWRYGTTF